MIATEYDLCHTLRYGESGAHERWRVDERMSLMRKFINTAMAKLSRELSGGLARLKKEYVDAAEQLSRIIDPAQEYPFDFVLFRLTGYKGGGAEIGEHTLLGADLRKDLLQLMLEVCDGSALQTSDYTEEVYETPSLAKRFKVSSKTIQRWRDGGLPARRRRR